MNQKLHRRWRKIYKNNGFKKKTFKGNVSGIKYVESFFVAINYKYKDKEFVCRHSNKVMMDNLNKLNSYKKKRGN